MAFRPDTDDLYIIANDGDAGEGVNIFHVKAFAKALVLYSQR
jgi:lactonase